MAGAWRVGYRSLRGSRLCPLVARHPVLPACATYTLCLPLQELLKPLQLACDTKSAKLVTHALSTAQKLLANGALSPEGAAAVGAMLSKVGGRVCVWTC